MGVFERLFGPSRHKMAAVIDAQKQVIQRFIRGRAEGADLEIERNRWGMANGLSANAVLSPYWRRQWRNRARYEASRNGYLSGMVHTLATDMVGTGPVLLLDCGPDANQDSVARVEDHVFEWHQKINLAEKLRIMRMARAIDGEQFGLAINNPRLRGVELDLRLIEPEMVADPTFRPSKDSVDGIRYDKSGNPEEYFVLSRHPGDLVAGMPDEGSWVDWQFVHHVYHATRAGQHRGGGEVWPALDLFAMLRSYQYSVVKASEVASNLSFVVETTLSAEPANYPAWEPMPMTHGQGMSLPHGWVGKQLKPEQPTSTFDAFERRILMQLARCLNMPYIVAVMDATGANYSTMRGDYLVYRKHIGVDRADFERVVLDPLLERWIDEASVVDGLIPDGLPPRDQWTWRWRWDGFEHIDPLKEAKSETEGINNRTATRADICQRRGRDWRQVFRQIKAELDYADELGITLDEVDAAMAAAVAEGAESEEDS